MNLSGIPTTEQKLLYWLMRDTSKGRISGSIDENLNRLLDGESLDFTDGERGYNGVMYVWWQFINDCGETSIGFLPAFDYDHAISEDPSMFWPHIAPFGDGWGMDVTAAMLQMGVTLNHPVLARIFVEHDTDYWGESSEYFRGRNLYMRKDYGMHYFPLPVFEIERTETTRLRFI